MHKRLQTQSSPQKNELDFLHKLSREYTVLAKHGQTAELYKALNDNSIISITDTSGVLTYVNLNFCTISQYTANELIGKTHRINKSGYHPDSFFQQMWQSISSGQTWKGEIKNKAKNGKYYWLHTTIVPISDEAGKTQFYLSIYNDITSSRLAEEKIKELLADAQETNEELKASEEELRQTLEHAVAVNNKIAQSERMYRLISESMRDMICLHEPDGRYTYISPSVTSLLGYQPQELLGTSPYDLFHPDDMFRITYQAHKTALNGNADNYIQYRIRKKNGEYLWFETITQYITDEYGTVSSLHTASRDITMRKQAEDQRDNFFNYSLDLMIITDLEGNVLRINNSWEKTFGYTDTQLRGQSLLNFLHPDDIESTYQALSKEQESGKPTIDFENRYQCKDGSYRWLSWNSITFAKEGLMYGFARDVTEKKQREAVLKNTLQELQVRNHELDNYVYKVSHDLRAPLCSIKGLVNLAKTEENMSTVQQYIHLIENRINKSDQFILSIINHSQILNSEPQIEAIDFEKIINDGFEELKYMPHTGRLSKTISLHNTAMFYNDSLRMNILFRNFISNSIKYQNLNISGNFMKFTIATDIHQSRIVIEDNGIGIEEALLPRVFDMFFRGTQLSEGSGMGLYIVKQTVERMGGSIIAESQPGLGTTFTLTLPNFIGQKNNK